MRDKVQKLITDIKYSINLLHGAVRDIEEKRDFASAADLVGYARSALEYVEWALENLALEQGERT